MLYRLPIKHQDLLGQIIDGLASTPKHLPAKLLYDERGVALSEALGNLPEYYVGRAEQTIFTLYRREIKEALRGYQILLEPGCGKATKTEAMVCLLNLEACVLIDLCENALLCGALHLAGQFPQLQVHAICADYTEDFFLPETLPDGRRLAYLPGSLLGDLEPKQAERFLQQLRVWVGDDGGALIGIDCNRDRDSLLAAHNDAQGATAEFNSNLLSTVNRIARANLDPQRFAHFATYNEARARVEMHLHSRVEQQCVVHDRLVHFGLGESIRTQNSYKFARAEFIQMAERNGFEHHHYWQDPAGTVSLHYLGADPIPLDKLHLPEEQEFIPRLVPTGEG